MKKIKEENLNNLNGGTNYISGTIINAFTNIIKVLMESGEAVGSSARRIATGNICPLK